MWTNEARAKALEKRLAQKRVREAVEAFEACKLPLSQTEREGCLAAIRRSPGRAMICYRAIRASY